MTEQTTQPTRKIFISYRQSDHSGFVERIRDWLVQAFGRENVFMDFDTLPPFIRFEDYLREQIREADIVLLVIAPDWVSILQERQQSGDFDYVKFELETAIQMNKFIAPICIMGASMPAPRDLPESIRSICDINVLSVSDKKLFYDDIQRVLTGFEEAIEWRKRRTEARAQSAASASTASGLDGYAAQEFIERAQAMMAAQDYNGAILEFTKAIRIDPKSAIAYCGRGDAFFGKKDYWCANGDYIDAIRLDPTCASAYLGRAQCKKEGSLREDFYGDIYTDLSTAIRLQPDLGKFYLARAAEYENQRVIEDYLDAVRVDPSLIEVYRLLGDLMFGYPHREYRKALDYYNLYLKNGGGEKFGDTAEIKANISECRQQLRA
ncbi:MAG: tetratricopeptide repeat protein [Anaerolineae bacterium]